MAKKKEGVGFDFEPVDKVPTTTRTSSTVYKEIVEKFIESGVDAWKIKIPDRKARNVSWGLYRYIKAEEMQDQVKAVTRKVDGEDTCFLTKV